MDAGFAPPPSLFPASMNGVFTALRRSKENPEEAEQVVSLGNLHRTDEQRRKLQDPTHRFACRLCDGDVTPHLGSIRAWHFAHAPGAPCAWDAWSEPESEKHRALKRACYRAIHQLYPHAKVEFEVIVREAGRIADVMATLPTGERIAVECQLAEISLQELETRTLAYEAVEVEVVWVFEKSKVEQHAAPWMGFYEWLYDRGNFVMLFEPRYQKIEQNLGTFDATQSDA